MIFNIQRFSTHDGDGIRTLIFYKGCPLQCQWCSNPESQSYSHNILYNRDICRNFGDCAAVIPDAISLSGKNGLQLKRELITDPEKLRDVCASKALTISGKSLAVDEILAEIEKDLPFYKTDGGVTLSGGEPLAQGTELVSLLQALHERHISTNMETSLHVKWKLVERCIGLLSTFLVDLKHTDSMKFRHYTKGSVELVLENLKQLVYFGAHVVVRIPVIPGFNHTDAEIHKMIDFVSTLNGIKEIHFLPYHTFGVEKYRMLGMEYLFNNTGEVEDEELIPYMQYAETKGFKAKIGG